MKRRGSVEPSRGVSEVLSVLFMVAVTIVLAAMVGSVLLDVVSDVDDTPLAAASVAFDGDDDRIRVVYTATQQNGTSLEVRVINGSTDAAIPNSPKTLLEVGESRTFDTSDGVASGHRYTVRIVASAPSGREAVILQRDGRL